MACMDVSVEGDCFQITITGDFSRSLLDSEENIRSALNEGGADNNSGTKSTATVRPRHNANQIWVTPFLDS